MRNEPDARREISVCLTTRELGQALGNRADDEQVEALRWWVKELGQNDSGQAVFIGRRLFSEAKLNACVIDFLRTILYNVAEDAKEVLQAATVPEK